MGGINHYLKESFNVTSGVAGQYGDWAVSNEGDIINIKRHYPIYSYQVNDDGWVLHLRDKTWFDKTTELNFLDAFEKACSILNIKVDLIKEHVRRMR